MVSSSLKGKRAEYAFASRCMELGLAVCFPCSEDLQYDFIVDNGKRLYKVQVKMASKNIKENRWKVATNSSNRVYDKKGFDYYAIWMPSVLWSGTWFIIPKSKVNQGFISFPKLYRDKKSKFGNYIDNWKQLL